MRNPSGVNGEGTVRMKEPGQHGEVRAELRDNTLRLYRNAELVKSLNLEVMDSALPHQVEAAGLRD